MTRYATVVAVPSDSSNAVYRVYVDEDGRPIFCDCPGFRLRRGHVEERKPCKHMRRLGAEEQVLEAARTVARTVGTGRGQTRPEIAAVTRSMVGRFDLLGVVEEAEDGTWAPIAGARFNNLEV